MSGHDNGVSGVNGSTGGATRGPARRARVSRRAFVAGAGAVSVAAWARRAGAQPKATITYWNDLTGADGKVMDELIDQLPATAASHRARRSAGPIYAKPQVAVPAGEGPDLASSTVEVPTSSDVLGVIDDGHRQGVPRRGLPARHGQGGFFQGKRCSCARRAPAHPL
jgi:hypothetical protein